MKARSALLGSEIRVVNIGLPGFAEDLRQSGVPVVQADWRVPGGGDPRLVELLVAMEREHGELIASANAEVFGRLLRADPVLVDVCPAGEVIPSLTDRAVLHAGPPLSWARMCGPMKGAIAGAAVFEGWASTLDEASQMAERGEFKLAPNHHFDAVGPMAGITTAHMPVLVVENQTFGNRAFCTLNEGLGKVMRFGGNDAEVINRLHWLADVLAPVLAGAVQDGGGLALKSLIARGLMMGDEMHQRNVACSSLVVRSLAPSIAALASSQSAAREVLEFVASNDQFFLNIAMATGKAMTDPCSGVRGGSIVTAMSRNGTDFGVRLSGTAERWFTAPVEMPRGLYFPGFASADANPDMGDSTIVETVGLGGFAMAAAPAVAGFVGAGSGADAIEYTRAMYDITHGAHPEWRIPALDAGVPLGIDARAVVRTGCVPTINTGIAHRVAGIGQVGAGIVAAPIACFSAAIEGLWAALGVAP